MSEGKKKRGRNRKEGEIEKRGEERIKDEEASSKLADMHSVNSLCCFVYLFHSFDVKHLRNKYFTVRNFFVQYFSIRPIKIVFTFNNIFGNHRRRGTSFNVRPVFF